MPDDLLTCAFSDRAFGQGILHGLKMAEADRQEAAVAQAEKMIEDGRKVLLAERRESSAIQRDTR